MTTEDLIREFLNPNPPDAKNRAGKTYITTSPDRMPDVCGICGKEAVTSSHMAGLSLGLCEEHKGGSIAIGGGMPIQVIHDGKTYEANGGDVLGC